MSQKLVQYSYKLKKQKQQKIISVLINLVILFIVLSIITTFIIFPVRQNSISMEPDFVQNSMFLVSPIPKNYKRGDVVLIKARKANEANFFYNSLNYLISFFTAKQISIIEEEDKQGTKEQIRRVIGLPGDKVYMKDYVVYVKTPDSKHYLSEFELAENTYNVTFYIPPAGWDSTVGVKGTFDEITLDKDEYFVLSDNRKASGDSRLWGPVNKNQIHAKVIASYFPFNKAKLY